MRHLLATLMAGSLLAVAQASETPSAYRTALPWARGATLFGDLSEGRYEGRRLAIRQLQLQIAPNDRLAFWLGESDVTAYGRSSGSRFHLESNAFAVRYRLGPARGTEFALQVDHARPNDAVATTRSDSTSTRTVYSATRLWSGSVIASRGPLDVSLGLGSVDSKAHDATTLTASVGYRLPLARSLTAWAQGEVVGQRWKGSNEAKSILRGQLRYAPTAWSTVTLEGTAFLNGLPFSEALGSFLLYEPSNAAAQGLRNNALGYGTLRLSVGFRF